MGKEQFLEIENAGRVYSIEIAETQEQLLEAKAIDDLVFGKHVGISMEELNEIVNHGMLLLLRDTNGILIGESQVITSPIPQHPNLASNEAYNYGTAVLPELQNNGIAQALFKAQEKVAIEAGKTNITLTVRLENAQSIRGRLKAGFQVVGYDPNHYDSFENGGARLIMEKNLLFPSEIIKPETLAEKVLAGEAMLIDEINVDSAIQKGQSLIGLPVNSGDSIDYKAHPLVAKIFATSGYVGIGLIKSSELGIKESQASLLILKHK